jgi:AhpD family alkylhydroperoxidase
MDRNYPQYLETIADSARELHNYIPDVLAGFGQVRKAVMSEGALSVRHKELIALALAIAARCEGCIATHINGALKAGASVEEISETIGVAIEMGGGPSVTYGAIAFEALQQFLVEREKTTTA